MKGLGFGMFGAIGGFRFQVVVFLGLRLGSKGLELRFSGLRFRAYVIWLHACGSYMV